MYKGDQMEMRQELERNTEVKCGGCMVLGETVVTLAAVRARKMTLNCHVTTNLTSNSCVLY